ncbi:MAG: hypothetical protein JO019_04710, partial [Candidatus Kaiserbacteria bacterium]|nr:hypothetical protein [Candidatus Kaiserbacteria bacterium]
MNMRLISFRFAPLFIVVAIFLASFQSAFALSEWHSINWAGYAAQRGYYTGVTATWTVPAVTLEDGEHGDSQWVGIGGVSTGDLIQVGTQSYMKDGELSYQAWYEMLPDYSTDAPLAVNAGDSVTATLSETSPGTWLIQITNNSTGGNFEKTVQYDSSHSSAEWVEEMMSNADATLRPLSRFGSVTFTNSYATDNGAQKSAGDESTRFYTMTDKAGNVITSVSPLSGDGTSFTASRSSYTVPQGMLSYLNIVPRTVTV